MTTPFDIPEGFDDAILLAFVEDTLPPAERAEVERRITSRPDLAALLTGMRRDRMQLAALQDPAAPRGLVDAALRALQQGQQAQALQSLRLAGEQHAEIQVSRVVPTRRNWWTSGRRAVAAAAILGLVGGITAISLWPAPRPITPTPQPNQLATETTQQTPDAVATLTGPTESTEAAPAAEPTAVAIADVAVPLAPIVADVDQMERALELARAGRLVIRVAATNPTRSDQQLASLVTRSESGRLWRASASIPADIRVALATPRSPSPESVDTAPDAIPATAIASSDERPFLILRPRTPAPLSLPPDAEDLLATAELSPTGDAVRSLCQALTNQLGPITITELAEPLADVAEAPTLDSVLWWSGSPARWARWVRIPVVIER